MTFSTLKTRDKIWLDLAIVTHVKQLQKAHLLFIYLLLLQKSVADLKGNSGVSLKMALRGCEGSLLCESEGRNTHNIEDLVPGADLVFPGATIDVYCCKSDNCNSASSLLPTLWMFFTCLLTMSLLA